MLTYHFWLSELQFSMPQPLSQGPPSGQCYNRWYRRGVRQYLTAGKAHDANYFGSTLIKSKIEAASSLSPGPSACGRCVPGA
jgi:hypothetical protein